MNATQRLHTLAQGLWLDIITQHLFVSGTLKCDIGELSVIGLTSNPTIFDHPIKSSTVYDEPIRDGLRRAKSDVVRVILDAAS
jgi:transaldolase